MNGEELLAYIWSGAIEPRCDQKPSALASLLDGVLAVPTTWLVSTGGLEEAVAFADSAEIVPGIQLGDVLFEELDINVPINSIILIEPLAKLERNGVSVVDIGRDLGQLLESVAGTSSRSVQALRSSHCGYDAARKERESNPTVRSV